MTPITATTLATTVLTFLVLTGCSHPQPDVSDLNRSDALSIQIRQPKMAATVANLTSGEYVLLVDLYNQSEQPIEVGPYLELEILDADAQPLKPASRNGRNGRRPHKCLLAGTEFETILPGQKITRKVSMKRYTRDPQFILGYRFKGSGTYSVGFCYSFDLDSFVNRCNAGCADHKSVDRAWTPAWEGTATTSIDLTVRG